MEPVPTSATPAPDPQPPVINSSPASIPQPVVPPPSNNSFPPPKPAAKLNPKLIIFIIVALITLLALAAAAYFLYLRPRNFTATTPNQLPSSASESSPTSSPPPLAATSTASQIDDIRLQLDTTAAIDFNQAIAVNVSADGTLEMPTDPAKHTIKSLASQPDSFYGDYPPNTTTTIGKLNPFLTSSDLMIAQPATLYNHRLYFLYRYQDQVYLGMVDTARFIHQQLDLTKLPPIQNDFFKTPQFNLVLHPALTPSPDGQYLAAVISAQTLPPYASSLLSADADLTTVKIIYSEFDQTSPSIVSQISAIDPADSWPEMHLLGWTPDNQYLYTDWSLESYDRPEGIGLAKFSLDGQVQLIDPGQDRSVVAISPNQQLLFTAKPSFGLTAPGIYEPSTKKFRPISIDSVVKSTREQIGPAGDTRGNSVSLTSIAYFSSDIKYLFFTINYYLASADSVTKWYQVDLSQNPLQPVVISSPSAQ